jgi:hypothetical protein
MNERNGFMLTSTINQLNKLGDTASRAIADFLRFG